MLRYTVHKGRHSVLRTPTRHCLQAVRGARVVPEALRDAGKTYKSRTDVQGRDDWRGLFAPYPASTKDHPIAETIKKDLVRYLLTYGDLTEVTYNNFYTGPEQVPYRWKYPPAELLGPKWHPYKPDPNDPNAGPEVKWFNVPDPSPARDADYQVPDDVTAFYLTATSGGNKAIDAATDKLLHDLSAAGFHVLSAEDFDHTNWIGYVAISCADEGARDIVVAWRGTVASPEWASDLDVFMTEWVTDTRPGQVNPGIKVHGGFEQLYRSFLATPGNTLSLQGQLQVAVRLLLAKYPGQVRSITTTGHSLGGALASLSAFDIWYSGINRDMTVDASGKKQVNYIPVTAVTFEAPRVGNQAYANSFSEGEGLKMLRVVNNKDIVPQVPLYDGLKPPMKDHVFWSHDELPDPEQYHHGGTELMVDTDKLPDPDCKTGANAQSEFSFQYHNLQRVLYMIDSLFDGQRDAHNPRRPKADNCWYPPEKPLWLRQFLFVKQLEQRAVATDNKRAIAAAAAATAAATATHGTSKQS